MQAQQITKGMQVKTGDEGYRKVLAVNKLSRTVILVLSGGIYMSPQRGEKMETLPARDAKGRFVARVHLVLSYCRELGDIVTTHLGIRAARRAVALHMSIWPEGNSQVV